MPSAPYRCGPSPPALGITGSAPVAPQGTASSDSTTTTRVIVGSVLGGLAVVLVIDVEGSMSNATAALGSLDQIFVQESHCGPLGEMRRKYFVFNDVAV